jgi:pimeloyl-ACP methyl ester carboxylesterase
MPASRPSWLLVLLVIPLITNALSPVPLFPYSPSSPSPVPLILLPGLSGSRLENDPNGDGVYDEIWPNGDLLIVDPWDLSLLVLRLALDGASPYSPTPEYASVRVGDVIRSEYGLDYYASTIAFFTSQGYTEGENFFVCPYDWRKDLHQIAFGDLPDTLDRCIQTALAKNPGASQVDLLGHSMGGLVARAYLSDPGKATRVRRLVTLGTPFLGAPKIVLAIIHKVCFVEWLGLCFSNSDVLHELIQNYPPGYQIAPSEAYFQVYPDGFLRRDRDGDGDGRPDGPLSPEASFGMLEKHNQSLARQARLLSASNHGWARGAANGVEVFAVVGDRHASIGTIVEYEKRPWYNPWAKPVITYRTEVTNGDGTVPLHSADLRDWSRGVDLTGGVPVFYFSLDHGRLASDPAVLQLTAQIFASPAPVSADSILRTWSPPALSPASVQAPRDEPIRLEGFWMSVEGPVDVEVIDANGFRLDRKDSDYRDGSSPGSSLNTANETIPGATYTELGESIFVFLPQDGRYMIHLAGWEQSEADIRLQTIAGDRVTRTAVYDGLPVSSQSLAVMALDPAVSSPAEFALDQDGDGIAEGSFPPSTLLDAQESLDNTSPHTMIQVEGSRSPGGAYLAPVTVSLNSVDGEGGSGVARIEYSLDGGVTAQVYQAPFQVDPLAVPLLLARATDRAMNEENPPASFRLSPAKIFIPAVVR